MPLGLNRLLLQQCAIPGVGYKAKWTFIEALPGECTRHTHIHTYTRGHL
jgi:hypothetical protein